MVLGGPTLRSGPSCEGADRSQIVPARWWVYFCWYLANIYRREMLHGITTAKAKSTSGSFKSLELEVCWRSSFCLYSPIGRTCSSAQTWRRKTSKFFWLQMFGVWITFHIFSILSLPRPRTKQREYLKCETFWYLGRNGRNFLCRKLCSTVACVSAYYIYNTNNKTSRESCLIPLLLPWDSSGGTSSFGICGTKCRMDMYIHGGWAQPRIPWIKGWM